MTKKELLKLNLNLYKKVYLARETEKQVVAEYDFDEMKTPMHMSMGEEAITAGVTEALGKNNHTFGTYRSHALYICITGEIYKFLAEMYGKETGVLKGKGGSMHLLSPEHGLLGISAVVSSTIPVATGAAFANKYRKNKKIVAVFFGDGAVDEGVFWESINIACLFKLPILFVCEDNGYAVHTPPKFRRGYKDLTKIMSQFNLTVFEDKTTDPESIYKTASKAIDSIKKKQMPAFLQVRYYRYLEHVGVHEDFNAGYRSKDELKKWLKIDPVKIQRAKLLKLGLKESEIEKIEQQIKKEILTAFEKTKLDPFPNSNELYKNLFYEQES